MIVALVTTSLNAYAGLGIQGNFSYEKELIGVSAKNGISLNDKDFKGISLKNDVSFKNANVSQESTVNIKDKIPFYHSGSQPVIK